MGSSSKQKKAPLPFGGGAFLFELCRGKGGLHAFLGTAQLLGLGHAVLGGVAGQGDETLFR